MSLGLAMPFAPELAVFGLAMLVLVIGLVRRGNAGQTAGWITLGGLVAALVVACNAQEGASLFGGSFVNDSLAIFAKELFLASAALSVLGSLTQQQSAFKRRATEYYFVLLTSVLGMLVLASARDLILLFVSFELMSIPLYVLTGFVKREEVASESALKFFLVGTASSAVIVYGMSFIFGVTGTTDIAAIPQALAQGHPLMLLGMTLLLAGLGFKIAAFPFHMWAPDAYEAASTPFVAWLAVAPKAAGFVAIIRLYVEGVGAATLVWMPVVAAVAGMTIVTGNLMAIPQHNIKRLLAYSGIAHIGYMLIGLAAGSPEGVRGLVIYLVIYVAMTIGAFACVLCMRRPGGTVEDIDELSGLAQNNLGMATVLAIVLFSMAGIPPLAGFFAKFYVFVAAVKEGLWALAVFGVLASVVGAYYYVRIVKVMFFDEPKARFLDIPAKAGVIMALSALFVLLYVVWPAPLVNSADAAARSLF